MTRRRIGLVTILAIALLLASPIGATDADDDFAPPTNARARRGEGRASGAERASGQTTGSASDPTNAVATAKAADRRIVQEVSFVLQHSLTVTPGEAANFEPAGVFTAKAHFTHSPAKADADADADADAGGDAGDALGHSEAVRLSHLRLTRDAPTDAFVAKFTKLLEDDLPYRIALPANVLRPASDETVMAFLPSRCLAESGLREHFVLHVDERANVIGVEYDSAGVECRVTDTHVTDVSSDPWFKTTSSVRFYKTAPRLDPDAPTDIAGHGGPAGKKAREAKLRRSSESNANGKNGAPPEQEKTFWQKNWMYIVPVMMLVTNLIAPPAPAAAAAPAAAPGGRKKRN
jgi:hypothetical protein